MNTIATDMVLPTFGARAIGRVVLAYLRKEWRVQASYRFGWLLSVLSISIGLTMYFGIDRLFGGTSTTHLAPYGGSYFAYVLVGNMAFACIGVAMGGLGGRLAQERFVGTLEAMLATPTPWWALLLAMGLSTLVMAAGQAVLYFCVGAIGFGVNMSRAHAASVAGLLGVSLVLFSGVGLAEAGMILVFKRGTPVAWALNGVGALLSGAFFPITVLPGWLQSIALWLPMTHVVRGLQRAMYQGAAPAQLAAELGVLGSWALLCVTVGAVVWRWALRRVRIDGSLTHY